MFIGYARTSTAEQDAGFEAQRRELDALGCKRIFAEQISSVVQRPELDAMLAFVREGDTVIVTKLDRLARSMRDFFVIFDAIKSKGGTLRIHNMGLDTGSATGELILGVLSAVGQFERSIMLERQRDGIAKAKTEGKYRGRKPTAMAKSDDIRRLASEGVGKTEIARRLKIGRASVYRALGEAQAI